MLDPCDCQPTNAAAAAAAMSCTARTIKHASYLPNARCC